MKLKNVEILNSLVSILKCIRNRISDCFVFKKTHLISYVVMYYLPTYVFYAKYLKLSLKKIVLYENEIEKFYADYIKIQG